MAKRFTSTEKWSDPWYRKLSLKHKLFFDWLYCSCDIAGSIDPDYELASFQIGENVVKDDLKVFSDRVKILDCGRVLLTKFIKFQYGELTSTCRAHVPVMKLCDSLSIPYAYPIDTHVDRDKEQDKEQDSISIAFKDHNIDAHALWKSMWSEVRDAGPVSWINDNANGEMAWNRLFDKVPGLKPENIIMAASDYKAFCETNKTEGQYITRPGNWLNAGEYKTNWKQKALELTKKSPNNRPSGEPELKRYGGKDE